METRRKTFSILQHALLQATIWDLLSSSTKNEVETLPAEVGIVKDMMQTLRYLGTIFRDYRCVMKRVSYHRFE